MTREDIAIGNQQYLPSQQTQGGPFLRDAALQAFYFEALHLARMAELLGVRLDDLQFDAKEGWRHVHPDDLRQANMALAQASDSVRRGAPLMEVETLCRVHREGCTRWLRTRSGRATSW